MKFCIDAGHGGSASGAVGQHSQEKNITLQLALKLRDKLFKSGIDVILTRNDDLYVDLQERCDIANKSNCDYFLSIHCNSYSDSSVSGTETFYYRVNKDGTEIASVIQNAAVEYKKNKNRGVKTADFYVLKYTKMPAVLLEAAFISNSDEEAMLNNTDWQDGFIITIAKAICYHLGITPNVDEILYRVFHNDVQVGAFKAQGNAMQMAEQIIAEVSNGTV